MAGVIDNVSTTDDYGSDASTGVLQNLWTGRGGSFEVANAAVLYSLQYGNQGEGVWTPDVRLGPTVGQIEPGTTGIKFRNYQAGVSARVFAYIAEGKEPILAGQQFAGTIAASGQVVPSGGVIAGYIIGATGAILNGQGFTVVHTGPGVWTITLAQAVPAFPIVTVSVDIGLGDITTDVNPIDTTRFIVRIFSAGVATDENFSFISVPSSTV